MEQQSSYNGRIYLLFLILFLGLLLLLLRLSVVQLGKGTEYAAAAESQRYAQQVIPAPRGRMFDRNGEILVDNKPSFSIQFTNYDDKTKQNTEMIAEKLAPVLSDDKNKVTKEDLIATMKGEKDGLPPSTPRNLKVNASERQVAFVKEHQSELPGISVVAEAMRDYPYNSFAAHLIGHMGPITLENRSLYDGKGYRLTDRVGYTGLEAQYESYLKGEDGATRVEVNINGDPIHRDTQQHVIEKKPVPGDDLRLTIDKKLQQATEQALAERVKDLQMKSKVKHAAAVAMDPNTGEILAMASYPTFDPNQWINGLSNQEYAAYLKSHFNYAVESLAPGSTVKMLTEMVGLKEGVITPEEKILDPGYKDIAGFRAKSWTTGLGLNDGKEALAKSSNVYMYTVAMRLAQHSLIGKISLENWMNNYDKTAVEKFKQYQKEFGLGVKTGIDLPYEDVGAVNYSEYEAINLPFMAIGQKETFSPLQLVQYVSTIANGGKRIQPYLVKEVVDANQQVVKKAEPKVLNTVSFSQEQLNYVKEGMWQVTHAPYGTASFTFGQKPYQVAGKTGTAETGSGTENFLFLGFAPYDQPKIAIAVIVPDGPSGAHSFEMWGPIAETMLDTYFHVEPQKQK